MATIVICGYMIRHPVAGNLLAFFHYLLGFSRLGHRIVYLEESGWPNACYDPVSQSYSDNPIPGIQAVKSLLSRFDVPAQIGFINRDTGKTYGLDRDDIREALIAADLLLNIGGVSWLPEFKLCQNRALIDMDPLFTQVGKFATEGLHNYQTLFSYGVNIGKSGCLIPTCDRDWFALVPPVVADIWAVQAADTQDDLPFTTIANWNAYGSITYQGKRYGQKQEEFLKLLHLPKQTTCTLELALANVNLQQREQLQSAGWRIRDSHFSQHLDQYQAYITQSRGEFSVAKQAYVATRSGWFSDRSVCYLAASRPVILQDTGFRHPLIADTGVLMFANVAEAIDRLECVTANYPQHCQAAGRIAREIFSYERVLPELLNIALNA